MSLARSFVRGTLAKSIVRALTGGGSVGCNMYRYLSTNTDTFELATSFTGEFQMIAAGTSSTGIPAAILAGITSTWVDTTDFDDPQWNYFSLTASALTVLIESTFDGYLDSYSLDGVWTSVDMGIFTPSYTWSNQFVWS